MDWQGWFSLLITSGVTCLLVFTRIAPHLVMMAALTILSVAGILTPQEALSGFANTGLITVAAMFIVAAGVHHSGGIDLLVDHLLGRPASVRGAMSRIFGPVTVMSSFLNNTPVVATLIPALHSWANKINVAPSKLMIPLSYSAMLGGTLTLIGTSTNLAVNGQYQLLTGASGFSLFSISAVSLPVATVGLLFMWLCFPHLLPDRSQQIAFGNLREFTLEVSVASDGPLVGKTITEAQLRNLRRVFLVEIERKGEVLTAVSPDEKLHGGDRLVFAGDTRAISDLLRIRGIAPSTPEDEDYVFGPERRLVEAVVSPHCEAIGKAIRDARFRDRYGAVVLAVARGGERVKGNLGTIELRAGDTLLLQARPGFVSQQKDNREFLLINDTDCDTPRFERAWTSWAILLGIVGTAGLGWLEMLDSALIGAGLMIATGCCSVAQAEKSLDLMVLVTIAASLALGVALEKSGVAAYLAENILAVSHGVPWLTLVLVYFCVMLLTEMVTNSAAALIMLPIVLEVTEKAHLNNEPFVFAIMMAASSSFATPIGYQCNLMVYGPGDYRFSDFLRVGIPMNLIVALTTLSVLLIGWPLQ